MGPFDNSKGVFVFDESVMVAHWFRDTMHGRLIILPREGNDFEPYGGIKESIDDTLFFMDDEQLDQFASGDLNLIEPVPDLLRRFDEEVGYFVA